VVNIRFAHMLSFSISEKVENLYLPNKRITCFPIHSDIPFEEQEVALIKPDQDELRIIVATNAAESSVTIPDVDNVICLGLCKQLSYNPKSHRQMLVPAWISKANATQRAGRTGRVAPGNVFRLYPREVYERGFEPYEMGEMLRIPLDSVILMLKEIIPQSEGITGVLRSCLEPPDLAAIDNSLLHLHKARFTTSPNDDCGLTELGKFVLALGIDLELGSLVGLGIQFGVGVEAIQLAGILACDKGPWLITNPLVHETAQFNGEFVLSFGFRCCLTLLIHRHNASNLDEQG
jgi:HrpA-like RNA helicase